MNLSHQVDGDGGRIAYLDGVRGLAIILVLAGHFVPNVSPLGGLGVSLFFALSGLLVSDMLFCRRMAIKAFLWRRAIRILPAFFVFIVFAIFWAKQVQSPSFSPDMRELLGTFLFIGSYWPAEVNIWSDMWPNGHLWSLNVEIHCYLILAIAAAIARRWFSGGGGTKWFCLCCAWVQYYRQ